MMKKALSVLMVATMLFIAVGCSVNEYTFETVNKPDSVTLINYEMMVQAEALASDIAVKFSEYEDEDGNVGVDAMNEMLDEEFVKMTTDFRTLQEKSSIELTDDAFMDQLISELQGVKAVVPESYDDPANVKYLLRFNHEGLDIYSLIQNEEGRYFTEEGYLFDIYIHKNGKVYVPIVNPQDTTETLTVEIEFSDALHQMIDSYYAE